ncbi:uncharacterized protein LOC105166752 isoform X1 [Sesamum indicum]|uniref:Uncharacterized protein LOC105166752 isoform X1 n=1 Tax=Sesamum indicum TaxID=4182 RepID=A0A6I9TMK7_SESIN|nr:uncharacterized protein LOC105166752 isoform X1 [Sesamum indicum]XP_011084519.1 uncharacterized protein LOC105166752 isoform X1 [Sesamum indicum]
MSTLKSDSGGNSSESVDGSYSFFRDHRPCKGNSSTLGLGRDAKWWLDHQGLGKDQLNVLDAEVTLLGTGFVDGNAKASGVYQLSEECYSPKNHGGFCAHMPLKHFHSLGKNNGGSWLQEFESTIKDDLLSDANLIDLDSCTCLLLERPKKLCSDMDSEWIGLKKIEPWWHAGDKYDSASLVSQTSSGHIRDHDHPGVESMHSEKVSDKCVNCFDQFKGQFRDKERKLLHVADSTQANLASVEDTEFSYMADCTEGNLASLSMDKSLGKQGLMEPILQDPEGTFSSSDSCNTAKVDSSYSQKPRSGDLSRTELLEALCHSQTRARKAEKLAQEACDEKDHVINLFFQQASCLFAYRQWLRMLQLETLCLHLRSRDQLTSFTPPAIRSKNMTIRRNRARGPKKKLGKHRCHINKYAIAFAVGLSLAGAGFLVGWTIGWLFPAF